MIAGRWLWAALCLGLLGSCESALETSHSTPQCDSDPCEARGDTSRSESATDPPPREREGEARQPVLDEPPLVTEARASGLLMYLDGGPSPVVESVEGDTTVYRFDGVDGPICMRGDPFRFSFREAGSDKLLIFLQGGGTCWSDFCLAVIAAPPGIPTVDALNPENPFNPMADWNVLYLPYCDGSFFSGNRDFDEDGDGVGDRLHRGLQNLSGALRTVSERMPDPERILLTGSSAGGFGTIPGTVLVRATYPEADLKVFNDSGVGVARPGEVAFVEKILDEQGLIPLFPETCEDCWGDGHITRLLHWIFERDPEVEMAVFSSVHDSVIAGTFLDIDKEIFKEAMLQETQALHARFPERYKRFIVQGSMHTTLLGTPIGIIGDDLGALEFSWDDLGDLSGLSLGGLDSTAIGEIMVSDWLRAFLEGDPSWVDIIEPGATDPSEGGSP